jgi:hypothetical protein
MIMSNMKKWMAAIACIIALNAGAQLVVDNTQTPEYLVQNVLLGGGVTVSNVMFNGLPGTVANPQIGSFDGTLCNVGDRERHHARLGRDVTGAVGPTTRAVPHWAVATGTIMIRTSSCCPAIPSAMRRSWSSTSSLGRLHLVQLRVRLGRIPRIRELVQ